MIVCDSSAIYKAVKSATIAQLIGQCTASLAFYELGNIIWKNSTVHRVYNQQEAFEVLGFCELALEKMRIIHSDLGDIYKVAARYHISFYDAAYVSLAIKLKAPLVTLDMKLTHKVSSIIDILPFERFIVKQ